MCGANHIVCISLCLVVKQNKDSSQNSFTLDWRIWILHQNCKWLTDWLSHLDSSQSVSAVSRVTDEQGHHYRSSAGTKAAPLPRLWWSRCLRWTLRRASEPPYRKGSEELDLFLPCWVTWRMRLAGRRNVRSGNIEFFPPFVIFSSTSTKDVLFLACLWLNAQKN